MGIYRIHGASENTGLRTRSKRAIPYLVAIFATNVGFAIYHSGWKLSRWVFDLDDLTVTVIGVAISLVMDSEEIEGRRSRQSGWMIAVSPEGLTCTLDGKEQRIIPRAEIKVVFDLGASGLQVVVRDGPVQLLAPLHDQSNFFDELRQYEIPTGGRWSLALHNLPSIVGVIALLLAMFRIFAIRSHVEVSLLALLIIVLLVLGARSELRKKPWDESRMSQAAVPISVLIALFVLGRVGYVFFDH